jgi:hypothetical protein
VMTVGDSSLMTLAKVAELGREAATSAPQSDSGGTSRRTAPIGETLASCRTAQSDAVVGGVGTGGTIVGWAASASATSCRSPEPRCILMCGELPTIEGISDGCPALHKPGIIDEIVAVDSDAAIGDAPPGPRVGCSSADSGALAAARDCERGTRPAARRHLLLRRGREAHQRLPQRPRSRCQHRHPR